MKNMRSIVDFASDALEKACGWAILGVALYAVFFTDFTGSGTLAGGIATLAGIGSGAAESGPRLDVAVSKAVPKAARDRVLIREEEREPQAVPAAEAVVAEETQVAVKTAAAAPRAKPKSWKRSLDTQLDEVSITGRGEQASVRGAALAPAMELAAADPAPTLRPTPGAAADAGGESHSRPGLMTRVAMRAGGSEEVRNIKK